MVESPSHPCFRLLVCKLAIAIHIQRLQLAQARRNLSEGQNTIPIPI